jgi:hypothetical protein
MDVDSQTSEKGSFSSDNPTLGIPSFGTTPINYESEIQPPPVLKKSQFSNNLRGHSKFDEEEEENSQMTNSFEEKEIV